MKRIQTLMAVPLLAGLMFVTGCDNDDEPLPPSGPTATRTNTSVPPTNTPVPVTNTPTHTATVAENTATPTPEATATETIEPTATATVNPLAGEYSATLPLAGGATGLLTFTVDASNNATGTLDTGSSAAAIIPVTGTVDSGGNFTLTGEGVNLTGTLPTGSSEGTVSGTVEGTETSGTVERAAEPTPTNTQAPPTDTPTATPTATSDGPIEAVCGDEETNAEAGEECDDGNNYGGDGCAANCTFEANITLDFGTGTTTESSSTVQTGLFALVLNITGKQVITHGQARTQVSTGADGFTNFKAGELPIATVINNNQEDGIGFIDPIVVPGLVCACIRGVELQTCGGRPAFPGSDEICTVATESGIEINEKVCIGTCNQSSSNAGDPCSQNADCPGEGGGCVLFDPPKPSCQSAFGPGVSSAGRVGCVDGLQGDDYQFISYKVAADSLTGDVTLTNEGDSSTQGAAYNLSFTAIGTIQDSGTCSIDESDPRKGPDGIPCTDDDPAESRGTPSVNLQTTGMATANVLNVNNQSGKNIEAGVNCGAAPCIVSSQGAAVSCENLAQGNTGGLCLASAFGALDQPTTGDIAVPAKFCALAN